MLYKILILSTFLLRCLEAQQVFAFWGQDLGGNEKPLSEYCNDKSIDVIVIQYLNAFDGLQRPKVSFKTACNTQWCASIGGGIRTCQEKGKKVILSLGGPPKGIYNVGSKGAAATLAQQLSDMFFTGSSSYMPLGDVRLDGIDLNVQNRQAMNYGELVNQLRTITQAANKKIMVTASPSCTFPDTNLDDALKNAQFDFVLVRFYNDDKCDSDGNLNFQLWNDWGKETGTTILMGIPGSRQIAKSGFLPLENLKFRIKKIKSEFPKYGGVAIDDASSAFSDDSFGKELAQFVHSSCFSISPSLILTFIVSVSTIFLL